MIGDAEQHVAGRCALLRGYAAECGLDRRLDGAFVRGVDAGSASGQRVHDPSAVVKALGPPEQSLPDEALRQNCQGARVDVQNPCEFTSRAVRKQADDAEHETLFSGHADVRAHPSRSSLHAMDDGPQQLEELENVRQGGLRRGRRNG